ncbi:response regulator [Paenibacillus sp. BR1-192]|uniref:response regulator transcription factor n=1 Tax=Paenibacillus sp. BR1-192 TaxID=3032287 RepID=UPI00240DF27D|nr:response regulator [Paenibacillus sp. BR1-192]WFB57917.1 response regulator [Paenibacillus sp. BR1-192]
MKALIVDDESRVRKAIRLLVQWEAHGITDIEEAANGLEAMELIPAFRPHLVLMDMLMPLKNGVDLMEWIHKHYPDIKFIVISGHDDFEFVRNTIWYSGTDYILKPIEEDVINQAVAKATAAWKAEEQERLAARQQHVQVNEYRPVYSEKLLSSLIDDRSAHSQVVNRLRDEGIVPAQTNAIRLAVMQIDKSDHALYGRFGHHQDLLMFALLNICNEFLQKDRIGIAFRPFGSPHQLVLLLWEQLATVPTLLQEINSGMFRTLSRQMHFGISPEGQYPVDVPELYAQCSNALRSRDLTVLNHFIHDAEQLRRSGMDHHRGVQFSGFEDTWKLAVLSGQPAPIGEAVDSFLAAIRKSGVLTPELLERWDREIDRFANHVIHETANPSSEALLKLYKEESATIERPSPDKYVCSLAEWQQYWDQLMSLLASALQSQKQTGQDLIHDITAFIEQNYQNDVSLYDIANRFHVSREYISRKFKQKHGINIPEHLNRIRISKAKILLQNPGLKMAAISEMVGFKNEKYFSLVFKKQEGISPKEFRKLHEKDA